MITLENFSEVPARLRGAFLTVGNFDGVHLGHARLLAALRARADAEGVPAVALTFNPHPVALLRPEKAPVPLVWPEREVELLRAAGADEVGVFKTGPWLLGLTAHDFVERVVVKQFGARGIVEGPNFAFGRDRGGDVTHLAKWCASAGIAFEAVEPTVVEGELVSSSRIRQCLTEGRVEDAARLLGRPHRVRGIVTQGAGRGAGLGFPTANLDAIDVLVPADGVYAARAYVDGQDPPWPAACNIGPNPTFGDRVRKVEAHLVGYHGDLYERMVEIDFLQHLRPTRKFAGVDELLVQVRADVDRTVEACQNGR